jgi:hypothetical protein
MSRKTTATFTTTITTTTTTTKRLLPLETNKAKTKTIIQQ